jgi:hypothetical protein
LKELFDKTGAAPGTPIIQLHQSYGATRKAEERDPDLPVQLSSVRLTVRRLS